MSEAAVTRSPQTGRLKIWIEQLAERPSARWLLFLIAAIEGAVFPLPPDPLLITLSVANSTKSFLFAGCCAAGSVVGSCIGYGIGLFVFDAFARSMLSSIGILDAFFQALSLLKEHGMLALVLAGFTPIPYAVFTIAAGMNQTLDFGTLLIGSIIGRSLRFGLMGMLFYYFGARCKVFMEQHFGKLSIGILFAVILLLAVVRWLL